MQPTLKRRGQIPSYFPQCDSAVSCIFQFATVRPHSASLYVPSSLWHLHPSSLWVHQHWTDLLRAAGLWKPWDPSERKLVLCSKTRWEPEACAHKPSSGALCTTTYYLPPDSKTYTSGHLSRPSTLPELGQSSCLPQEKLTHGMHLHLFSFFPSNPTGPWVLSIQSGKDVSVSILPVPHRQYPKFRQFSLSLGLLHQVICL